MSEAKQKVKAVRKAVEWVSKNPNLTPRNYTEWWVKQFEICSRGNLNVK